MSSLSRGWGLSPSNPVFTTPAGTQLAHSDSQGILVSASSSHPDQGTEVEDLHGNRLGSFGFAMNDRADLLYGLSAEGLLAASGTHRSRNTADENALPINSEDLVNPFLPALLGVTDWADRHAVSLTPTLLPLPLHRHQRFRIAGCQGIHVGQDQGLRAVVAEGFFVLAAHDGESVEHVSHVVPRQPVEMEVEGVEAGAQGAAANSRWSGMSSLSGAPCWGREWTQPRSVRTGQISFRSVTDSLGLSYWLNALKRSAAVLANAVKACGRSTDVRHSGVRRMPSVKKYWVNKAGHVG